MGKWRAVEEAAKTAEGTADAARLAAKTAEKARAVEMLNRQAPKGDLGGMFRALDEYQTLQKAAESTISSKVGVDIGREIDAQAALAAEKARVDAISNPFANPTSRYQTVTRDEFATRLRTQLDSPEYAIKYIAGHMDEWELKRLRASQKENDNLVNGLFSRLNSNSRWTSKYKSWLGNSPYEGRIYFHVDKYTDPVRGSEGFVQFENPREMGVHMGSNSAAQRIIHPYGHEYLNKVSESLDSHIQELAGILSMDSNELRSIIARQLNSTLESKFSGKGEFGTLTKEWNAVVDLVRNELGAKAEGEASKLLYDLKGIPTPNTTPVVFKGKNGLLLNDAGNWFPDTVGKQLQDLWPDDYEEIQAALSSTRSERSKNLQRFIESKGYDHIVYFNGVEDRGSLSIINWNPDLMQSIWSKEFIGDSPEAAADVATQAFLIMMGGAGAAVQSKK